MTPDDLIPLLYCPLCAPPRLLTAPLTLHCGHTVCADHLPSPSSLLSSATAVTVPKCPLPTCQPSSSSSATLNPASGVAFSRAPPSSTHLPGVRVDVTANKIVSLVLRARTYSVADRTRVSAYAPDADEHTDEESDGDRYDQRSRQKPGPSRSRSRSTPVGDRCPCCCRPHRLPPWPTRRALHPPSRSRSTPSPPPSPSHDISPRPRKRRRRRLLPSQEHSRPDTHPDIDPSTRFEKELQVELTCEICFGLLWQPVTTPCQHTFCSSCLHRALDHSPSCPLCRQTLPGYDYFQEHPYNKVVLSIIHKAFPEAYAERAATLEAEARDARLDTPLFVCQLSFPGMRTDLHFFEPRYRLMLRRCLATPHPRFGMIPEPHITASHSIDSEYGTMLEIRNVHMLPDGRSLVETWGSWRFRVMERGTLDGYIVARVERIDDLEDERGAFLRGATPDASPALLPAVALSPTNEELLATCHMFLDQVREGSPWVVERMNWLPIDPHEKAKLLPIRSPRLRLRLVVHWIEQLNNHWWFSGGCIVC
ncbi:PUA-like domain-containing protein [Amylocystis lapponica]|nr:PUA-like domain-containing protein [Amylocystis lapponica]